MSSGEVSCGGCEMVCESSCIGICAGNCIGSATTNMSAPRYQRISIPSTTKTVIRGTNTKYDSNSKR